MSLDVGVSVGSVTDARNLDTRLLTAHWEECERTT